MDTTLAGASVYLRLAALAAGAACLATGALADPAGEGRAALARLMAETLLPETGGPKAGITRGAAGLAAARSLLV